MSESTRPDPRATTGAAAAQTLLLDHVEGLTDDEARRPSLLPGWSIGHVLTHLARNAEGMRRMIDAAARGEIGEMYPGGHQRRNTDIEDGSSRPAAELVADLRRMSSELVAAWDGLAAVDAGGGWNGTGRTVLAEIPITDVPLMRWREVTVHHADLGPVAGRTYSWGDWPDDYVRLELVRSTMLWASRKPMGLTALPERALAVPEHQRVAWLLGRAEIDGLGRADEI